MQFSDKSAKDLRSRINVPGQPQRALSLADRIRRGNTPQISNRARERQIRDLERERAAERGSESISIRQSSLTLLERTDDFSLRVSRSETHLSFNTATKNTEPTVISRSRRLSNKPEAENKASAITVLPSTPVKLSDRISNSRSHATPQPSQEELYKNSNSSSRLRHEGRRTMPNTPRNEVRGNGHKSAPSTGKSTPQHYPTGPRRGARSPPAVHAVQRTNWLFTREEIDSTPSITGKNGKKVPAVQERHERARAVVWIMKIGRLLKLPQETVFMAAVFMHRFFMRNTLMGKNHDRHKVAAGSVFLASKASEQHRPARDIALACIKIAYPKETPTEHHKDFSSWMKALMYMEEQLMIQICFDFNVISPEHYFRPWAQKLGLEDRQAVDMCYRFMNDCMFTPVVLLRPSNIIAGSAIYYVQRMDELELPDKWWERFGLKEEDILACSIDLAQLFEPKSCSEVATVSRYQDLTQKRDYDDVEQTFSEPNDEHASKKHQTADLRVESA